VNEGTWGSADEDEEDEDDEEEEDAPSSRYVCGGGT
jgi:hypothetical protein